MDYIIKRPKLISFGGWLLIALACLVLLAANLLNPTAHALSVSSGRDCDDNAVLRCGALTTNELQQKYHGTGVIGIFNRFGIASSDISSSGSTAVAGQVTRSGNVLVNGQIVATNAITAGRQNMSGSTKVMAGGVAFYERPPSVSFASSPLAAFVFMNNGQFSSAIIASCGNPVRATAVVRTVTPPAPTPQPTPPPATTPPPQVKSQVTPPPAPTPTPSPQPQELSKTGPAQVIGLGVFATIAGTIGHYFYLRRRSI
jgi:hypothetical protein